MFGNHTVLFVSFSDGARGALGTYTQVETVETVHGCRHRPLTFKETAEYDVDVATEVWKTTAPPLPAVLNAKADGELRVNGIAYRVIGGPRPHADANGRPFKVTLISERKAG